MKITKKTKKFIFFWSIFHLLGYTFFLTGFSPSIDSHNSEKVITSYNNSSYYRTTDRKDYLFIPNYRYKNDLFPSCSNCEYSEDENFWPFHRFTYSTRAGASYNKGFVGIWGYYGHYEFLFYMVLPFLILSLTWVYQKHIR